MESITFCPRCRGRGTCCCDDDEPSRATGEGAKGGVKTGTGSGAGASGTTTSHRGHKPDPSANSWTKLPFTRAASQPSPTVQAASAVPYVFDDWALASAIAVYAAYGNIDIAMIQSVW